MTAHSQPPMTNTNSTPGLHRVFLSLGSNLNSPQRDKRGNIQEAIRLIDVCIGHVDLKSSIIATAPWGFESDNEFVNAAVGCLTTMSPLEVLAATQNIERRMGRKEKSHDGHYHDRIIDIDILMYDNLEINLPQLQLPHPLMHQRDFVMIPLKEIIGQVKL